MGCRQSKELVKPVIKYSTMRQEVSRFLPSLLTQGETYAFARPNQVCQSKPSASTKGVMNLHKEKPEKYSPNTTFNIVEPYLHGPRDTPKDWTVVFVLGGPGCGKGTQCELIGRDFGFLHLSAGHLLREEVKKGTSLGQNCEKLMKEGKLVPLEVTLNLLHNAMNSSGKTRFLIDGFPRTVDQAKAFEKKVCMPDKVLFLECPKSVMEQRLMKRGETSGRVDDTPAIILKRFETFEKESLPVAAYYENLDPNVILKVSSVPPPDLVYNQIQNALKNLSGLKMLL